MYSFTHDIWQVVITNNNRNNFSNYSLIHTWVNFQVSLSIEQTRGNVSGVIYKLWAQLSKLQQRLVVIWNRSERENSKHNMIDKLQHSTFLSMTNNTTHKQHQVQGSFFYSVTKYLTQKKLMFWSRHILTHISDILYLGTLMKRKQLMSANI